MPKHEVGTPKYLAKKMKSKGLQKLRWYCQVCEKQCRDENGFKCHVMSESHHRQMKLVGSNADKHINDFSKQFNNGFIDLLSKRFSTRRVHANQVYQEYIRDKEHVHMNATRWHTLSAYVMWLGKEGICHVEETDKGWFITWIDNSPDALAKRQMKEKKAQIDFDSEKMERKLIEKQIEKAKEISKDTQVDEQERIFHRTSEKISLDLEIKKDESKKLIISSVFQDDEQEEEKEEKIAPPRPLSPIKETKDDNWIVKNIIVKVMNRSLCDGKYYKQKGVIVNVINGYIAEIQMNDSGDIIQIDQEDCETVIPRIGGQVIILTGRNKGKTAELIDVDFENFDATLQIFGTDKALSHVPYEHFSKKHVN